ncbi:MAG: hydroxymethylbilane synthase [Chloroflexota bacterium]
MTSPPDRVIVGTRGSPLAVRQTQSVVDLLRDKHRQTDFVLRIISTQGDLESNRPISEMGDKGVFVRSIERALLDEDIDLAVHSLKDVPSDTETPGLVLAAYSTREDPRDVLVSCSGLLLSELPFGARVGTSSLRRRTQLHYVRPDIQSFAIRGNVDTRLEKLGVGQYDAIILAAAGLHRLGMQSQISQYLSPEQFLPAAGQGILALQAREDTWASQLVSAVDDSSSRIAAIGERAVVRGLHADCHSPVGAFCVSSGETFVLIAMAASEDGMVIVRDVISGHTSDIETLGHQLGECLLAQLES